MKKEPGRLDWEGARARLRRIQDSIERMETPTAEELLRVHKARAAHFARAAECLDRLQTEDELIVFRLGGERYAFEVAEVTEVLPEPKVATAPGAPPSPSEPPPRRSSSVVTLDIAMRQHIETALRATQGRVEGAYGAAKLLAINPHTLRARMKKLGIDWSAFRQPPSVA